jgi:hypothetical protein
MCVPLPEADALLAPRPRARRVRSLLSVASPYPPTHISLVTYQEFLHCSGLRGSDTTTTHETCNVEKLRVRMQEAQSPSIELDYSTTWLRQLRDSKKHTCMWPHRPRQSSVLQGLPVAAVSQTLLSRPPTSPCPLPWLNRVHGRGLICTNRAVSACRESRCSARRLSPLRLQPRATQRTASQPAYL